ncbi:VanZ like protein [Streptomyces sp. Ag109_O5-1]|nr:VanZ family protein [Streptomyces sp. Ag109_O5-1]RPE46240.1 VanZ like protein [Streptomyces sp. Ag109_O5-1]
MASAASRLRFTKGETTEETKKDGDTGKKPGVFAKAVRVVKARGAEPAATPGKGKAAKPAGTGKKTVTGKAAGTGKPGGTARTRKPGGTGKPGSAAKRSDTSKRSDTGKKGTAPARTGAERRPLPLPLRLLAMAIAFAAMVAFAAVLARLTLEPSPASASIAHTNLHPGTTIKLYLDQPSVRDTVKQIGGNVMLGLPFGILVPVLAPNARGILRVLALTAIVMLLVEMAQGALVNGRAFDVDDVILNTSGALIGWLLLGRRLGRAVHARKPKA